MTFYLILFIIVSISLLALLVKIEIDCYKESHPNPPEKIKKIKF